MKKQFSIFIIRWILNSFALWVAIRLLSTGEFADSSAGLMTYLLAGLVLSIVNTLVKPIIIILSLPAIILTLGLFILIVNGFMVYLALSLVHGIHVTFFGAVLAGMILSLTNYVLSGILDLRKHPKER